MRMISGVRRTFGVTVALGAAGTLALAGCGDSSGSDSGQVKVGLVTKTNSNPYFVTLREAAQKEAKAKGAKLYALAGKFDGDNAGQVKAIENLIAKGVKGILITPSNSKGVLGAIKKARDEGIVVIALDTATNPASAVDATYATDNKAAGSRVGKWAKATLGKAAPKVVLLKGTPGSAVEKNRRTGWLQGFGIQPKSPAVVGTAVTNGQQNKAQKGLENLLQAHPDVNAIYTINEPAARGAHQALKEHGMVDKVVLGAIDGSCQGVRDVKAGTFGATVMQFPGTMATKGVDAVVKYAKTDTKPSGSIDTGSKLITDKPVSGVDSKDTAWGLKHCWGK